MKRSLVKKIIVSACSGILLLAMILIIHIYWVYRSKTPDVNSRVLARMDIKQQLTNEDSSKITSWMYRQKGVDHVLVNPHSNIVVFTFFPVQVSGNKIVQDFKTEFPIKAERFMPTAEDLKNSCPVAASSFTYKIYKLITRII